MTKLVICDFDDTLVLERDFIKSGFAAAAQYLEKNFGIEKGLAEKTFWTQFGKSPKNVFDKSAELLLGEIGKESSGVAAALVEIYRYHLPAISYQPDVPEFLELLRKLNMHSAIVTDGDAKTQHNKLKAVSAQSDFEKIVVTSDFGRNWSKPSPKAFEHLRRQFGIPFEEMVYIGDNPLKDFAVSAAIAIKTAKIEREGAVHTGNPYLNSVMPNFFIKKLTQIFDFIK